MVMGITLEKIEAQLKAHPVKDSSKEQSNGHKPKSTTKQRGKKMTAEEQDAFVARYPIEAGPRRKNDDGRTVRDVPCPFGPHTATISISPDGIAEFHCFHTSEKCNEKHWSDYERRYEPDADQPGVDEIAALENAIAEKDAKALFAAIPTLAKLSRIDYLGYEQQFKAVFPKRTINWNTFNAAVGEARRAVTETQASTEHDMDTVAEAFKARYGDTWAYDTQQQTWRRYIGTHWAEPTTNEEGKHELDRLIVGLLHELEFEVTHNGTLDCVHRLAKSKCMRTFHPRPRVVNFHNGTLHVDTMRLEAHRKEDDLLYCHEYDYQPGAGHPNITRFLMETYCIIQDDGTHVPDYHAVQAYEAHVGLALRGDTDMQNFLVNYGAKRGGKSTTMRIANATCGNTASNYSDYAGDSLFSPELEGKRVRYTRNSHRIVCADELSPEALRQEGIIKNMSAHSGVEMRGMHKDEQMGNQWRPKLLLSTNELPHYKDTCGALKERAIYLHVPYERPQKQRNPKMFEEMLLPEIGAFAHTCILLSLAVEKRWYYPQSANMKRIGNEAASHGNTLKSFIEEECILDPEAIIPSAVLYERFMEYRLKNGHSRDYAKQTMVSAIKEMNIGVKAKETPFRYGGGKPVRCLWGIRLKMDGEDIQVKAVDDDDLLMLELFPELVQTADECYGCNGHVTVDENNRNSASSRTTSEFSASQNGACYDVTTKTEFSDNTKDTMQANRVGGVYREKEKAVSTVTSLQASLNAHDKPAEQCYDTSEGTVTGPLQNDVLNELSSDAYTVFRIAERLGFPVLPLTHSGHQTKVGPGHEQWLQFVEKAHPKLATRAREAMQDAIMDGAYNHIIGE